MSTPVMRNRTAIAILALSTIASVAGASRAAEVSAGLAQTYSPDHFENALGQDFRVRVLDGKVSPYVALLHNPRQTSFVSAGLERRWSRGRWYVEPGLGLGYALSPAPWFGSRLLFHVNLALGVHLTRRVGAELGLEHWSNAYTHRNNPGDNAAALRVVIHF